MKITKIIMGMPITVAFEDKVDREIFQEIFNYFRKIDQKFSTYKKNSEISQINDGKLTLKNASSDVKKIFKLAKKTKEQTEGFFDIYQNGKFDPSGIVKGWAILNAANLLKKKGINKFFVDAGGDIEVSGHVWKVGIRNPFNQTEIVKVLYINNVGIATSGNYIRGDHIWNPNGEMVSDIVSLTVIGPDILEADRFATAAFAMGKDGINFIERQKGLEGYMIDKEGIATMTSGFGKYEAN